MYRDITEKDVLDYYYPVREKINSGRDLVVVMRFKPSGVDEKYRDIENYEELKLKDWIWNDELKAYEYLGLFKFCIKRWEDVNVGEEE